MVMCQLLLMMMPAQTPGAAEAPVEAPLEAEPLAVEVAPTAAEADADKSVADKKDATPTPGKAVADADRVIPGFEDEVKELFGRALSAVKAELDPAGILNPGVLVDPI